MTRLFPVVVLVCVLLMGGMSYEAETKFVGVMIGPEHCNFVFRTPIGRDINVAVPAFCESHQGTEMLVEISQAWLKEHPIDNPEETSKRQKMIRQLQRDGYDIEKNSK